MDTYDIDADGYLLGQANPDRGHPGAVAVPPPDDIPPAQCRWVDGQWVSAPARPDVATQLAAAWAAADAWARAGMDDNARISIVGLLVDPSCPPWRAQRIADFRAWWAALWAHYGAVRTQILAGQVAAFDVQAVGPCPWSIWQIAGDQP